MQRIVKDRRKRDAIARFIMFLLPGDCLRFWYILCGPR